MKKYFLEFTVLIAGAAVMVIELCGSRLLAPFVGVSILVWTSLIGIILGSLSLGYYLGGRMADKGPGIINLPLVIFLSSLATMLILIIRAPVFLLAESLFSGLSSQSVFATLSLFVLPNIFLGMVSPLAAKIKITNLGSSGTAIGNLYAFSTLGSIIGTFITGFYLISNFSVSNILLGVSVVLFLLSILLFFINKKYLYLAVGTFLLVFLIAASFDRTTSPKGVISLDSQYNHIRIIETYYRDLQNPIRVLSLDNKWDSAIYLNSDKLIFDYTNFYLLTKDFNPAAKKVLMIGGGAYTVPKVLVENNPDMELDVVEIDPKLLDVAKEYFKFTKNSRLKIYHEDGRTFLNRETKNIADFKKYDAILIDAFKSYSIPFHLTTVESIKMISELLSDEGVVIVNIISAIEGEKGKFLRSEYHTFKSIFPQVEIYPLNLPQDGNATQNIMLVALKSQATGKILSADPKLNNFLNSRWNKEIANDLPLLTDDFAPVDQYIIKNEI